MGLSLGTVPGYKEVMSTDGVSGRLGSENRKLYKHLVVKNSPWAIPSQNSLLHTIREATLWRITAGEACALVVPHPPAASVVSEPFSPHWFIWLAAAPLHQMGGSLQTRVPWLSVPFEPAVGDLFLQFLVETGWGSHLPATLHAVSKDGIWDSSWSISKLDNEQKVLIRGSSWGIVAVDVINDSVVCTEHCENEVGYLGTLCFSSSAIFYSYIGPIPSSNTDSCYQHTKDLRNFLW